MESEPPRRPESARGRETHTHIAPGNKLKYHIAYRQYEYYDQSISNTQIKINTQILIKVV